MRDYIIVIVLFIIASIIIFIIPQNTDFVRSGKLYINEIGANNNTFLNNLDETSDYIEIYNGYNYDIDLEGYYLSDSEYDIKKWVFPSIKIKAKSYLVIYATGLNTCDNDICHTNFKLSSLGETVTLTDNNGNIISKVKYPKLDIDTSYSYVGNKYIVTTETPTSKNSNEEYIKDNKKYNIKITEYMTHNNRAHYDSYGNYYDWVELYNDSDNDLSLKNIYISDNKNDITKYKLPDITLKSKEYVVVYLTNEKVNYNGLYVPFALSDNDKNILISNGEQILDIVDVVVLKDDMSYGLKDNKWEYFFLSTPGRENNTTSFSEIGGTNGNS